jgi:hypothetical protein
MYPFLIENLILIHVRHIHIFSDWLTLVIVVMLAFWQYHIIPLYFLVGNL